MIEINYIQGASDDTLRTEIAELCGYTNTSTLKVSGMWRKDGEYKAPPLYCEDLNGMHEAEKILNGAQAIRFRILLTQYGVNKNFDPFFANARQRAETFVMTLMEEKQK